MPKRRLAAILSLDVVGYSHLMQAGSRTLLKTLNVLYRDVITPAVDAHSGRVVKLLGDGALIEFLSAGEALETAIAIQTILRDPDHAYRAPDRIQLRAGLHVGDVTIEGDDIFGDGIHIATRLQAAAEPGGLLVSRVVCDLAGFDVTGRLKGEGLHSFKGITDPIEVLSVDFVDTASTRSPLAFATSQKIQYCRTADGLNLAWSRVGDGTPVVKAPNWIGHLERDWHNAAFAPILSAVAEHHQLVRFDARLNGLSDWDADTCTFDSFVIDLKTIFDSADVDRAPILALSQGSAVAAAFAARWPERVSAIVMIGGFPVGRAKRTSKKDVERATAMRQMMTSGWDDDYPSLRDLMAQILVPGASQEDRRKYAEDMRKMISPENIGRYRDVIDYIDIRSQLSDVTVPCLICHATGDRMQPIEQGRLMAKGLPNARFIAYESANHCMPHNDPEWPRLRRDVLEFLSDHRS